MSLNTVVSGLEEKWPSLFFHKKEKEKMETRKRRLSLKSEKGFQEEDIFY